MALRRFHFLIIFKMLETKGIPFLTGNAKWDYLRGACHLKKSN